MKRMYIITSRIWSLPLGLLLLVACGPRSNAPAATQTIAPTLAAEVSATPAPTTPPPPAVAVTSGPAAAATLAATPAPQIADNPPTATVQATRPPLGSAERPIQLLFPPVAAGAVIMQRVAPLAEALGAATGAEFAVGVVDSEAALVELLCSAPEDVVGFVSAAAYVIAHDECKAQAGLVAVREDGLPWQMGMLVIQPGGAADLADLAAMVLYLASAGMIASGIALVTRSLASALISSLALLLLAPPLLAGVPTLAQWLPSNVESVGLITWVAITLAIGTASFLRRDG